MTVRATALVRLRSGREAELSAVGLTRKHARRQAVGLMREGETLVSVEYDPDEPVPCSHCAGSGIVRI